MPLNVSMAISRLTHIRLFIILLFLVEISIVALPYVVEAEETVKKNRTTNDIPDCIVESEYGSVNWTTGVVRAKGRNRTPLKQGQSDVALDTMIMESATNSARENLFQILRSIGMPHKSTYEKRDSVELSEHTLIAKIKKTAVGAKIVKKYPVSGQTVEVVLETSIYGDFLESVLPPAIEDIPDIELFEPENQYSENQGLRYTGMIIDARGIGLKPVICPSVVSEQGEEIYSPMFISRKYAVDRGVSSYICSLDPVIISSKVGNNPLTIKGLRKDGDRNYAIVISMSDSDRIQKIAERHIFMRGCRVIILVSR